VTNNNNAPHIRGFKCASHPLKKYDFDTRGYDMQIGRWLGQDAHAESYPGWSPYNYNLNNPARYADPTGMDPDSYLYNNGNGHYLGTIKDNLPNAAVVVK
jgi:RHS repeat-associated protein